jgi:hypothetical protein
MKIYSGRLVNDGIGGQHVRVQDKNSEYSLRGYNNIINHSPDGFNWGYYGSGPSQLAFAILMDMYHDKEIAFFYYSFFKQDFVAKFKKSFEVNSEEIDEWFNKKRVEIFGEKI